ncbi:hypothetical protein DFH06DRAFT_1144938 [Mycena polygramma]|nr:hypothetical protein DFH06DRAFT_1144938 [Mycena polygramma]
MQSPYAQYLRTNYVPSEAEVKGIHSHLIAHTLEVSRLEALIQDLSDQRQKTLDYIAAHEALVSPARRMPQDVVQEVFLACLPTQRNSVMSTKDAPLLLARICSAWRTLALSTPALWASLHIPLEYVFDFIGPQRPLQWLERSGRCPLSLTIVGARGIEHWEKFETEEVESMVEVLSGCADRWRSIELCFETTEGISRLADVYPPSLMTAKIYGAGPDIRDLKLLTTPNLREVVLRIGRDFDDLIPLLPLHWSNLTHLLFHSMGCYDDQGLSPNVVLEVLHRCPRIVSFESDINNRSQRDFPDFHSPILLPAIREFILLHRSSPLVTKSVTYFLRNLAMPELRRLVLPYTMDQQFPAPFLGHLATRSPFIEDLSVNLSGLAQDSLVENLVKLSSLKRLVIWDNSDGTENPSAPHVAATVQKLFTFLMEDRKEPPFPLLAELQLKQCNLWDDNRGAALVDFVRQLLELGAGHFKRLEINYTRGWTDWAEDILAEFDARGLTVTITRPSSGFRPHPPTTAWLGLDPSLFEESPIDLNSNCFHRIHPLRSQAAQFTVFLLGQAFQYRIQYMQYGTVYRRKTFGSWMFRSSTGLPLNSRSSYGIPHALSICHTGGSVIVTLEGYIAAANSSLFGSLHGESSKSTKSSRATPGTAKEQRDSMSALAMEGNFSVESQSTRRK